MTDRATPLPSFHFEGQDSSAPPSGASSATNDDAAAGSASFLQVPSPAFSRPQRPRTPSVRLSYRDEAEPNSNSIYRRARAATVGDRPRFFSGGGSTTATAGSDAHSQHSRESEPARINQEGLLGRDNQSTNGRIAGGRRRRALSALNPWSGSNSGDAEEDEESEEGRLRNQRETHDRQVIDLLDVIDPEVGTLTTLSDVQNSLFVPDLGRWVDRTRYLRLTKPPSTEVLADGSPSSSSSSTPPPLPGSPLKAPATIPEEEGRSPEDDAELAIAHEAHDGPDCPECPHIIARGKYLVMPEGLVDWEHWDDKDKEELDDYVRHLLHSKKWKARRTWQGFKQYFKTPLGAFVTIYASLLTFWGAAWVLFIIGWLNAGNRQAYFVEICDQVLTALFCVVGIGLAPFRAVDTYHMIFIAKYHRKTLRLYKERGAPPLPDENDLPSPTAARDNPSNAEEGLKRAPVLTVKEQATFIYHQTRFSRSHTFYRPHETFTHKAFPLDLLIVVVCLLDFHSIFQIALGSTTWSISYHHDYKKILTSIILSFSISCNISAGLVILVGNRRTRKEEVVRELLHKAVTEEAVRRRLHHEEKERKREVEEKAALVEKNHSRHHQHEPFRG